MSVFPEKSLKIYHFALFGLTSPIISLAPPRKWFRGGRRGQKSRGGNAPFVPPPKPPLDFFISATICLLINKVINIDLEKARMRHL